MDTETKLLIDTLQKAIHNLQEDIRDLKYNEVKHSKEINILKDDISQRMQILRAKLTWCEGNLINVIEGKR